MVTPKDKATERLSVEVEPANYEDMARAEAGTIHLAWGGRSSLFDAIVEPDRDSALIGATVLGNLDLIVDRQRQTLAPRDPKRTIFEAECAVPSTRGV